MTEEQKAQQQEQDALGQRTQTILAERIGMLVIGSARLQAEAELWAEKAKAAKKAAEAVPAGDV